MSSVRQTGCYAEDKQVAIGGTMIWSMVAAHQPKLGKTLIAAGTDVNRRNAL